MSQRFSFTELLNHHINTDQNSKRDILCVAWEGLNFLRKNILSV